MIALDRQSELRLQCLYPDVVTRTRRVIEDYRLAHARELKCAQGIRSFEAQLAIWKQGRELRGGIWIVVNPRKVVTRARPGDSWHHYSAVDLCFAGPEPYLRDLQGKDPAGWEFLWSELARFGEAHGFQAGYRWPDPKKDRPHLELRYGGMTLAEVKQIYAVGGLRGVWTRFDQIRGVRAGSEWDNAAMRQRLAAQGINL